MGHTAPLIAKSNNTMYCTKERFVSVYQMLRWQNRVRISGISHVHIQGLGCINRVGSGKP